MTKEYKFTNDWFANNQPIWEELFVNIKPEKILEVGSFEGAATCYMIDKYTCNNQELEIHCLDTWEGGIEHRDLGVDMLSVESRFDYNIKLCTADKSNVLVYKHKEFSYFGLAKLIAQGKKNYFDFIYIDGSHQAADVLCDAVLGFHLLKVGGYMVFDDYLWSEDLPNGIDIIRCPKPAIDAFTSLNFRKLKILIAPLYQLYLQKISD